MNNNPIFHLN